MKLKANGDQTSVSVGDDSYNVDHNGFVDIPNEFVSDVLPHGFHVPTAQELADAGETQSDAADETKKPAKKSK